jgi:hypothetical protein
MTTVLKFCIYSGLLYSKRWGSFWKSCPRTLYTPQSTYIYRVAHCMSSRRNWDSPTTSLASECAPSSGTKGGGTLACGWRVGGVLIPMTGKKLALHSASSVVYTTLAMTTFWRTIWWKNQPSLVRVGVVCPMPTPFHYIYHRVQSFYVCPSWEGRYTPPISNLPLYMYSVVMPFYLKTLKLAHDEPLLWSRG